MDALEREVYREREREREREGGGQRDKDLCMKCSGAVKFFD